MGAVWGRYGKVSGDTSAVGTAAASWDNGKPGGVDTAVLTSGKRSRSGKGKGKEGKEADLQGG